jgi:P-type Ca2+ transporter type 2C
MARDGEPAWHALGADEALRRLGSSLAGLAREEVEARRARHGTNVLVEAPRPGPFAIALRQFRSLLVGLLVVAAVLAALLGEWIDGAAILTILLLNAAIGFLQEWRAENAIAALRRMTAPRAKVRRAGAVSAVPASELVPGDVVLLEAGDLVPADLRLLEASSLRCVEAALTGESEPIDKTTQPLGGADLPLGDRTNLAFVGTSAAAGAGSGVVTAIGMATELGRIAHSLQQAAASEEEGGTPLERRLQAFGRVLVWTCLGLVILLFGLGLARGMPAAELALTSISLAVAAVPEGLPAVATVALALGVSRMARRRALVRRLPAVETLGSANVICTDKTGTLTVGEMTVRELRAGDRAFRVVGEGYAPEGRVLAGERDLDAGEAALARELLGAFVGCCDAHLAEEDGVWQVIGDPTEGALLAAGAKLGVLRDAIERDTPRLRAWPFDATRKRMSIARRGGPGRARILVKGAPEAVLERCDRFESGSGVRPLGPADRARIAAQQAELSQRALRVLAAAVREADEDETAGANADDAERGLVFLGLVGMVDPPRAEARSAVARCREAGIRVVMITGDHPQTGLAIARELGIASAPHEALAGPELEALSEDELARRVETISVYARVSAAHKLRIVRAWQSRGAVVAMTGDGVNDAPAIRGADIGIAMGGTGTEVTKQASDMIVTDDDFSSIVAAVEEGRGIFDNIRKTVQYLLAGNAAELMVMTVCIAGGLPTPLLPIHLLWINLVTDGLPALCLATDPIDGDVMRRPPRRRGDALADRATLGTILLTGALTAAATVAAYLYGLRFEDEIRARTHAFAVLVFAELLRAFGGRSETKPLWRMGLLENARLSAVVAASFALQIAAHHVEPLRTALQAGFLPWSECVALVGVALAPVLLLELVKVSRRRRRSG